MKEQPSSTDQWFGESPQTRSAFSRNQRRAIWERDDYVCQYPTSKDQKCAVFDPLGQVHHISPQAWDIAHTGEAKDTVDNGILLCKDHHIGSAGVHKDQPTALLYYRNGDSSAFSKLQHWRQELAANGIPYWDTEKDHDMRKIAESNIRRSKRENPNWHFPKKGRSNGQRNLP